MRRVGGDKIQVKWIENPYFGQLYNDNFDDVDRRQSIPYLLINDKFKQLEVSDGIRAKYFHKSKIVIKIADGAHNSNVLVDTYNSFEKEDLPYFAKLLAVDDNEKFIVQEFVPLKPVRGRVSSKHSDLVKHLRDKYKLDDLDLPWTKTGNWGINSKTNQPVIFDFLSMG